MRSVLTFNIINLVVRAHKWRNTDINGNTIDSNRILYARYFLYILVSIIAAYFLGDGIDNRFVGYAMAAYSIFVGLFLNMVLNVYDKYVDRLPKETGTPDNKIIITQLTNFTDQFISLTVYAIFIAFICIVLLSLTLLSEFLTTDLNEYRLIRSIDDLNLDSLLDSLKYLTVLGYRAIIIYLSIDFVRISLFAISAMYQKMLSSFPSK